MLPFGAQRFIFLLAHPSYRKRAASPSSLNAQLHVSAERRQAQSSHLEMLLPPRYADNYDAQKKAEAHMAEPSNEAAEKNPQDVHRDAQATRRKIALRNRCPEWP